MAGHSIDQLLTGTVLPAIQRMSHESAFHYLAFGQISICIELFGACCDAHALHAEGKSRARFELGISRYMAKIDVRYARYIGKGVPHDLYKYLRCGMAHVVRPGGGIGFTSHGDLAKDGTTHLEVYAPLKLLILSIEDFWSDFDKAAKMFIADLPSLDPSKVGGIFLPVHDPSAPEANAP